MGKLGINKITFRFEYSCAGYDVDPSTGVETCTDLSKWVSFEGYDPTYDYVAAVLSQVKMISDKVAELHNDDPRAFDIYSLGVFLSVEGYSGYELKRELLYDEIGYIDSVLNVYNKIIVDFEKKWNKFEG